MTRSHVEALLQTGETETAYRRAGSGSPVILLFVRATEDPLGAELFQCLAERFRVIAPAMPVGVGRAPASGGGRAAVAVSQWLRDVIEGLGLVRPRVVVDESFAGMLLGFFLMERERVGGVVVVHRDHADPASTACPLEDRLEHASQRLLVVSVDAAVDARAGGRRASAQILPFLERDE